MPKSSQIVELFELEKQLDQIEDENIPVDTNIHTLDIRYIFLMVSVVNTYIINKDQIENEEKQIIQSVYFVLHFGEFLPLVFDVIFQSFGVVDFLIYFIVSTHNL